MRTDSDSDFIGKRDRIRALENRVSRLESVVYKLIAWISQSAGSPLRVDEAKALIKELTE